MLLLLGRQQVGTNIPVATCAAAAASDVAFAHCRDRTTSRQCYLLLSVLLMLQLMLLLCVARCYSA